MLSILNNISFINTILIMFLTIGGFMAFRNGRRAELTKFQKETIEALQQRIENLEGKIGDVEKENIVQRHVIETITEALKQRGMIITISGDLVSIEDSRGTTTHRKRVTTSRGIKITEEKRL